MSMGTVPGGVWTKVCGQAELPCPGVRAGRLGEIDVAVFRLADGRLLAIEDRCPHRGARLSAGVVYEGDKVACLDHGWSIRLSDGGVEPPEHGCVRTYPVKAEDGAVFVLLGAADRRT
jgi:nitrite reductase (NADH) small subunit